MVPGPIVNHPYLLTNASRQQVNVFLPVDYSSLCNAAVGRCLPDVMAFWNFSAIRTHWNNKTDSINQSIRGIVASYMRIRVGFSIHTLIV